MKEENVASGEFTLCAEMHSASQQAHRRAVIDLARRRDAQEAVGEENGIRSK
jgi:hypothetical protein